jgi:hypothetical protein
MGRLACVPMIETRRNDVNEWRSHVMNKHTHTKKQKKKKKERKKEKQVYSADIERTDEAAGSVCVVDATGNTVAGLADAAEPEGGREGNIES